MKTKSRRLQLNKARLSQSLKTKNQSDVSGATGKCKVIPVSWLSVDEHKTKYLMFRLQCSWLDEPVPPPHPIPTPARAARGSRILTVDS